MRKRGLFLVVILSMVVQLWAMAPLAAAAEDGSQNLGFESALDGWTQYGSVTADHEKTVHASLNTWVVDSHNEKMAILQPEGDIYGTDTLKTVMNLSDSSMSYITGVFPYITNVAYIYRDITLNAGQTLTMSWNYTATDYEPYNDASLLCMANLSDSSKLPIINGYYSDVSILGATVIGTGNYSTGSYGSTGWQTTTVKAAFAGTYRLGFVVFNLGDTGLAPYLFLDDQPGTTTLNGDSFSPIDPDDNPPPMQPVIALNYDKTIFHEDVANDGTINETSTITLTNDTFAGNVGEPVPSVTYKNTPDGLTPSVIKTGDNTADLRFAGKAVPNESVNDMDNFEVIFGDGAFTGGDASKVLGADTDFLGFDFDNAVYTVNFFDSQGNLLKTESVENGSAATPPTPPDVVGYHFDHWSAGYQEITGDTDIEALYLPNEDTQYTVEYYVPDINGVGYVLKETDTLAGTTATEGTAPVKEFDGLEVNTDKSTLSGTILPDGSLVLSVYYDTATPDTPTTPDTPNTPAVSDTTATPDTGDTGSGFFPWMVGIMLSTMGLMALQMTRKTTRD